MPLQATSGAASYDAFGGGVPVVPAYIEEVFSTWLYTGNNTTNNIVNGIDLSGKGGLVWGKARNIAGNHYLVDTARGAPYGIRTATTGAQTTSSSIQDVTAFNSNGFSLGIGDQSSINNSGEPTVSWTFREQPKFFDIVTYTGTGTASQTVSHNLGSTPGCVIIKRTDSTSDWFVGHRYDGNKLLYLNTTAAATSLSWNSWIFDSTTFRTPSISGSPDVNVSSATYVAYVFAHDAGGFGLTGTDNVISCGSFTTDGGGLATVSLGYEPQWLMIKRTGTTGDWQIMDTMRGFVNDSSGGDAVLKANSSDAESTFTLATPTSTGFLIDGNAANAPIIYIAIRRGPMAVPTSGTSVFSPVARAGTGATATITGVGFPPDLDIPQLRNTANGAIVFDRLRGATQVLLPGFTNAEYAQADSLTAFSMDGVSLGADSTNLVNGSTYNYINWMFRRAPGYFDTVCYTGDSASSGTGNTQLISHNLTVTPEMIIVKRRSGASDWVIWTSALSATQYMFLDSGAVLSANPTYFFGTTGPTPSATQFKVGDAYYTNASGSTYVAYLFATVAGVSKVGSYTGTGTTLQINCGFTSGARFVLIKRTDSTGDWYVWDTARGIVSGNDSYLLLNSTAAEVTNTDYIDTYSAGFEISSTAPAAINASGGSFIFFAVA